MLLWGGQNGRAHRRWLIVVLMIALGAAGWYARVAAQSDRWPGGSSQVGLICGVAAACLMAFECALWPRRWKYVRAWRWLGRTQDWLRAHIWLGVLTVPLVVLHTGFTWGGPLSTALAGAFAVVIASGVIGLTLQHVIPRILLQDVGGETIYAQIDHVQAQHVQDADMIISALCGEEYSGRDAAELPLERPHRREFSITKLLKSTAVPTLAAVQRESLGSSYQGTIRPLLKDGPQAAMTLSGPAQLAGYFRELRGRLDADAHPAVDLLEQWCLIRRDLQQQRWLHWLLHSWLALHLPISLAMMALLALHIYAALKYW